MSKGANDVAVKANLLRKWSLVATTEAGSGHPSTCLSAADLAAVLFDKFFKESDRFVLSKGHAAPLLYAIFAMAGAFPKEELSNLRKLSSDLEGHPTPRLPFVEAATGSLGQGLSVGAGIAYSIQNSKFKIQNSPKVYVLLGDGEMAEGSIWEAANFTSYYKLSNLIAVVDVNRLGQSGQTMFGYDLKQYSNRFAAFGWETVTVDGHKFSQIEKAFSAAQKAKKPFAIIAKTKKGKGVPFLEDKEGWHGKPISKEELERVIKELGSPDESLRFSSFKANRVSVSGGSLQGKKVSFARSHLVQGETFYKLGDQIATREAYGFAIVKLGKKNQDVIALDAEVKNSTYAERFKDAYPSRFIECFIAEQNMAGVALGLSACGKIPFASSFACFLTRAFDQIRMSAISGGNIKFVGSHAGVSIGEDGPSQMGLEDIAMFGVIPDSIVFHPADGVSTEKLVAVMAGHNGISYLRTLRPKTPILYDNKEAFEIGGSKVLRQSEKDELTIVAAGITVHEALKAYEILMEEGITVRVIDCYSIKPIDRKTLKKAVSEMKQYHIVVVEDHFEHGGLGDFVLDAVSNTGAHVSKLAVKEIARSGTPAELLDLAGISAIHIVEKVKNLL